jgi:hypothetical protein
MCVSGSDSREGVGDVKKKGVTRVTQAATLQLNPASGGTQPEREGGCREQNFTLESLLRTLSVLSDF